MMTMAMMMIGNDAYMIRRSKIIENRPAREVHSRVAFQLRLHPGQPDRRDRGKYFLDLRRGTKPPIHLAPPPGSIPVGPGGGNSPGPTGSKPRATAFRPWFGPRESEFCSGGPTTGALRQWRSPPWARIEFEPPFFPAPAPSSSLPLPLSHALSFHSHCICAAYRRHCSPRVHPPSNPEPCYEKSCRGRARASSPD